MSSYRKHKGWVKLILIRKVTDIAAIGIEEKNEPKRFEKAFKDVPKDIWHVLKHQKSVTKSSKIPLLGVDIGHFHDF